jgi:hypothetical protein
MLLPVAAVPPASSMPAYRKQHSAQSCTNWSAVTTHHDCSLPLVLHVHDLCPGHHCRCRGQGALQLQVLLTMKCLALEGGDGQTESTQSPAAQKKELALQSCKLL